MVTDREELERQIAEATARMDGASDADWVKLSAELRQLRAEFAKAGGGKASAVDELQGRRELKEADGQRRGAGSPRKKTGGGRPRKPTT